MNDGQFCIVIDSQELCLFIGNMNGDYHCELGVIEDAYGMIKIVKLKDIRPVSDEEAKDHDPIMYDILKGED